MPTHVVIDLDSTDDPPHGHQAGTASHGFSNQPMYHPVLLVDGETDQLITAVRRPGNAPASHGVVPVLKRVARARRARWPGVTIERRRDSGCAVPAIDAFCEQDAITYTIGLVPKARLDALAAPLLADAQRQRAETGTDKVRLVGEVPDQAGSWPQARRVIVKAEALAEGPNTRFVVTARTDAPESLDAWDVDRGEPETWIKDRKRACFADRLSDHCFWANQFRLLRHAAASWLLDTLRRWLVARAVPRMQLDTLRLRLLTIGGRVGQLADRVRLRLASSHPGCALWVHLATLRTLRE